MRDAELLGELHGRGFVQTVRQLGRCRKRQVCQALEFVPVLRAHRERGVIGWQQDVVWATTQIVEHDLDEGAWSILGRWIDELLAAMPREEGR